MGISAARHAMYLVPEVTYGTTPANPPFERIRHTGTTLGLQRGSLLSDELRPDRQISDFRLGTVIVGGDISAELSYGSFDKLLEAALCGTWTPVATLTAATLSAAAADDSFSRTAGSFVTDGFVVGKKIKTTGFATGANNGTWLISIVTALKLTVTNLDGSPAAAIVLEAAGAAVTIQTTEAVLKAGTVRRSFTILRHFTDIPDGAGKPYHVSRGCEVNTLAISVNPTAIVGLTFGIVAREPELLAAPIAGQTLGAPTTTAPMDAFTGVLKENNVVCGVATEISLALDNGLEPENIVGSKFTRQPAISRTNATGSMGAYFDDSSYLEKFINETDSSMEMTFPDGAGNSYTMKIPLLNYTGGQPDASGQGSIRLTMPFQGIMDPVSLSNIIITRTPAA